MFSQPEVGNVTTPNSTGLAARYGGSGSRATFRRWRQQLHRRAGECVHPRPRDDDAEQVQRIGRRQPQVAVCRGALPAAPHLAQRVTASGRANCSPRKPSTNRPPRTSPRASSVRSARSRSRQGGASASRAMRSRNTTPQRRSSLAREPPPRLHRPPRWRRRPHRRAHACAAAPSGQPRAAAAPSGSGPLPGAASGRSTPGDCRNRQPLPTPRQPVPTTRPPPRSPAGRSPHQIAQERRAVRLELLQNGLGRMGEHRGAGLTAAAARHQPARILAQEDRHRAVRVGRTRRRDRPFPDASADAAASASNAGCGDKRPHITSPDRQSRSRSSGL